MNEVFNDYEFVDNNNVNDDENDVVPQFVPDTSQANKTSNDQISLEDVYAEYDGTLTEIQDQPTITEMFNNNQLLASNVLRNLSNKNFVHGEWSAVYDKGTWSLDIQDKNGNKLNVVIDEKTLWISDFGVFSPSGTYSTTTKLNSWGVTTDVQNKYVIEGQKYFLSFRDTKNEQYCLIIDKINDDWTVNVVYDISSESGVWSSWRSKITLIDAIKWLIELQK